MHVTFALKSVNIMTLTAVFEMMTFGADLPDFIYEGHTNAIQILGSIQSRLSYATGLGSRRHRRICRLLGGGYNYDSTAILLQFDGAATPPPLRSCDDQPCVQ